MDYNDNDYEGHNLNLAGEESSKSSSALRSFSIPKYDFDDSLHAHLKYDSLVENEVFLGIPSQDDNQWIEDYSRGSSGAVFSSNATEPCALPRCNNIWSEATSSESVEMLLKAVGQEEAIPGESMVDESDPVHQQGPLIGQMGSKLREACNVDEVNPLLHPSDMEVDYIDTSSKKHIGESVEQDTASHISFVTSSYTEKGISVELAEKQEVFSANDEILSGNAVEEFNSEIQPSTEIPPERESLKEEFADEAVNSEMQCSLQIPPEMVPLREEFPVETINLEMQFSREISPEDESCEFAVKKSTELAAYGPGKGESVSTVVECSEIAVSAETLGGNECGGTVFSSSSVSMLHEVPGVAAQGEKYTEEFGIRGDDVTEPLVDQPIKPVGVADIYPERNSSLEATFEDSTLAGVVNDISEQDPKSNMDDANGNSMDSSVGGEFGVEKLANEIREARRDLAPQKESLENVGEGDLEVFPCEGIVSDNNGKEGVSNLPGEGGDVQAEKAAGSPGIEGEHTKVTSSHVEPDDLVCCTEQKAILFNKEQTSQDEHLDASTGPSTSVPNDSLEVAAEVAPSTEIKNSTPPVSVAAGGTDSPYLVDTCNVSMCDEVLNERTGNPASDLIVQNDISKASPSGMLEVEGTADTNSYITSGNVAFESGESKQVRAPSGGEKTFTFDIQPLEGQSAVDSVKGLQSFPRIKACVLSSTEEASLITPSDTQKDKVVIKGKSRRSSSTPSSGGQPAEGIVGPSGRKTRRGSSKGKGTAEEGNPPKDKASRKTLRVGKSSTPSSPLVIGQLMQFESAVRPTSSTPDPNTSNPPPPVFLPPSAGLQQPYTDSQQLQLRAQILVYGSLIQGAAPEESCMVAAFSLPDGDKSVWESSLKTCRERIRNQNQGVNMETPFQSRGALTASQSARKGSARSEQVGPSQNPAPSPSFNQIIPMSSPLWSMSTPSLDRPQTSIFSRSSVFDYRPISPLHPYQTPPLRNFVAPTTSWSSQAPVPVPWLASPLSSPPNTEQVAGVTYSAFPNNVPVTFTPTKESNLQSSSGTKPPVPWLAPPLSSALNTEQVAGVTFSAFPNNETTQLNLTKDSTVQISSGAQPSVDTKTRKRKKPTASLVDTASASPSNAFTPKVSGAGFLGLIPQTQAASTPAPVVSYHHSTSVVIPPPPSFMPKGTSNKSCEGDDLLGKRALNVESVKKVDVAKVEAEEASAHANLAVSQCEDVWNRLVEQSSSGLTSDAEAMLASAAIAIAAAASVAKAAAAAAKVASSVAVQAKQMVDEAISKCGSETPVVSVFLSAAREAARKRVEAASTATKNAENLDAIVKAAELAAEAVSHTGKIVGMGDPFSLDQLMKYGLDGYWKTDETNQTDKVREVPPVHIDLEEGSDKNVPAGEGTTPLENDTQMHVDEDKSTGLKEGSIVEVLRDIGDSKKAWFSAKILRLKDGAAFVTYTELHSEGSELPTDWVPLEAQGGNAPVLRVPFPMILGKSDGTRKRNRAAARDYAVGDRAEAYVKDCWREAIVVDKNKIDPTLLAVSFPGGGENKFVKVWHLRPIFIWSDGQWREISTTVENAVSQGDTPVEKRQKLGDKDAEEIMGRRVIDFFAEKGADSSKLPLAAKDNVFSIGSTKDENPNMVRTKRSGLQKGGSNVVYGVPKPTKKFIDMSKHYVAEKTLRQPEPNGAATKSSKNAIQQGSSSRGFRSYSNPDVQEKETSESKGKAVRTPRPPIVSGSTAGPTMVFASQTLRPDNKKKALPRNVKPGRNNRGKVISSGKLPKTPARTVNPVPEPSEPRRSVRRIQPTSRLLEGIQSSLIMPTMHGKTDKTIHKGSSSRGSESRD